MTSSTNSPEMTPQYRAELTLNDGTIVSLQNADEGKLKHNINKLIGGRPPEYQEPTGAPAENVALIFHETQLNGALPCGWVAALAVPYNLSARSTVEQRFGSKRAA